MTHRLAVASVALCGVMCGCHRAASDTDPQTARVQPLFGPVMTREVIGGRAGDGRDRVWLLANGQAIVGIDLQIGIAGRTEIARPGGKTCWGLARLDDGSLWTLFGRSTLAEIGTDGHIAREIALLEPHFGLYARGDRLVYQPARFVPSGSLLFAGVPGNLHPEPWSAIEPRSFPAMARASAAALNMVVCGATSTAEQPCWFPDDTSIALVGPAGQTRRVALSGLTRVAPEVLLAADNPARPLRDVFVEESGTIWVLSSGTPPLEPAEPVERIQPVEIVAGDVPGGWLLAEYTGAGAPVRMRRLSEPVRLILEVKRERLIVLSGTGMVAEVRR